MTSTFDRSQLMRTVRFRPYLKGHGPTFTLRLFDQPSGPSHQYSVGYELLQHEDGNTIVLFAGADFSVGACTSVDSDAAIEALMGFLTLRLGDTDREYFLAYTPTQLAFCQTHAETLGAEVSARYTCCECGSTDLVGKAIDGRKYCKHHRPSARL